MATAMSMKNVLDCFLFFFFFFLALTTIFDMSGKKLEIFASEEIRII